MFLTQTFLLLVASGRRISDALSSLRAKSFLQYSANKRRVAIGYDPSYRFNNKTTGKPEPIVLHRYKDVIQRLQVSEEVLKVQEGQLCPLLSVETYLAATRHNSCNYLFCNPQ